MGGLLADARARTQHVSCSYGRAGQPGVHVQRRQGHAPTLATADLPPRRPAALLGGGGPGRRLAASSHRASAGTRARVSDRGRPSPSARADTMKRWDRDRADPRRDVPVASVAAGRGCRRALDRPRYLALPSIESDGPVAHPARNARALRRPRLAPRPDRRTGPSTALRPSCPTGLTETWQLMDVEGAQGLTQGQGGRASVNGKIRSRRLFCPDSATRSVRWPWRGLGLDGGGGWVGESSGGERDMRWTSPRVCADCVPCCLVRAQRRRSRRMCCRRSTAGSIATPSPNSVAPSPSLPPRASDCGPAWRRQLNPNTRVSLYSDERRGQRERQVQGPG